MTRKLQAVAVLLLVFSTMAWAQGQDPFVGTWKQNMAKSKFDPASQTPKGPTTIKREAAPNGGLHVISEGTDPQGKPTRSEYTAKYDGKDYPVTGSANYDTESFTRIDSNTRIIVYKKGSNVVRMQRQVVAKDGKSSTNDDFGAYANSAPFHNVSVFDKQ